MRSAKRRYGKVRKEFLPCPIPKRRFHLFTFRRVLPLFFLLFLLLSACGTQTNSSQGNTSNSPVSLTVFAASSLTESFNEIKTAYHTAHPNVTLTYNYNGSQTLEQQLANGAPGDIFASADQTNMKKAS